MYVFRPICPLPHPLGCVFILFRFYNGSHKTVKERSASRRLSRVEKNGRASLKAPARTGKNGPSTPHRHIPYPPNLAGVPDGPCRGWEKWAGVPDALIFFCLLFFHQGKKRRRKEKNASAEAEEFGADAPHEAGAQIIQMMKLLPLLILFVCVFKNELCLPPLLQRQDGFVSFESHERILYHRVSRKEPRLGALSEKSTFQSLVW